MRLLFIYGSGFLLLLLNTNSQQWPPWKWKKKDSRAMAKGPSPLSKIYHKKENVALAQGYITGEKKAVALAMKKHHRNLNLLHLFTPSGLHFSSLLLLFLPLSKILHRINPHLPLLITLPLYLGPFFLREYFAIKRIAQYRLAKGLLRKKQIKIDSFWIFLGVFILDFFFGTYRQNPLSFSLSYLFLGILFSVKDLPRIYIPLGLMGGQILVAFCFQGNLTHLGFLGGFFLTGLFIFIFPLILLNYLLPWANFSEVLVESFAKAVATLSEVSVASGFFYPEINIVLLVFFLAWKTTPRIIPILLLFSTSTPLYNVPAYAFKEATRRESEPFFATSSFKRAGRKGEVLLWKHRMKVHHP